MVTFDHQSALLLDVVINLGLGLEGSVFVNITANCMAVVLFNSNLKKVHSVQF